MSEYLTKGTKTLLAGPPGSGKTTSLITFIEAGLEVFVHGTENGFEESLLDAVRNKKLPIEKLHFQYVPPTVGGFDVLRGVLERANTMGFGDLATMKNGINKHEYRQFFALLDACNNFVDDRTGQEFGPIDSFARDKVYCLDSLTGLNKIAMQNHVGGKPCLHEGEWQVVQNTEENFLHTLVTNLQCFVVVTAHIQKAFNQITGETAHTVDATGAKLGPRLPCMFSDFILARKAGAQFRWSTMADGYDLKNRALSISDTLQPSFVQLVDIWKERNATAALEQKPKPALIDVAQLGQ